MVFSLKNIDDAGFGLRDSSKLESLINRKSETNRDQAELVNVWGSCGHVFVATNAGRNLHAFESIPRSKWTPESESLLLQGMCAQQIRGVSWREFAKCVVDGL